MGFPTTRIFSPQTSANELNAAFYGYDIAVQNDKEYYIKVILHKIGLSTQDDPNFSLDFKW